MNFWTKGDLLSFLNIRSSWSDDPSEIEVAHINVRLVYDV